MGLAGIVYRKPRRNNNTKIRELSWFGCSMLCSRSQDGCLFLAYEDTCWTILILLMITLLEGMKEQVNEKHMKSQVWVDWFKKKADIKVKTYGRFNEQSLCDLKLILPRLNPRLGGLSGPTSKWSSIRFRILDIGNCTDTISYTC